MSDAQRRANRIIAVITDPKLDDHARFSKAHKLTRAEADANRFDVLEIVFNSEEFWAFARRQPWRAIRSGS